MCSSAERGEGSSPQRLSELMGKIALYQVESRLLKPTYVLMVSSGGWWEGEVITMLAFYFSTHFYAFFSLIVEIIQTFSIKLQEFPNM